MPTAQMSAGPEPHMPSSGTVVRESTVVQAVPSQCASTPPLPPAHTSFELTPQALVIVPEGKGLVTTTHPLPFQCRKVPSSPTAHRSEAGVRYSPRVCSGER